MMIPGSVPPGTARPTLTWADRQEHSARTSGTRDDHDGSRTSNSPCLALETADIAVVASRLLARPGNPPGRRDACPRLRSSRLAPDDRASLEPRRGRFGAALLSGRRLLVRAFRVPPSTLSQLQLLAQKCVPTINAMANVHVHRSVAPRRVRGGRTPAGQAGGRPFFAANRDKCLLFRNRDANVFFARALFDPLSLSDHPSAHSNRDGGVARERGGVAGRVADERFEARRRPHHECALRPTFILARPDRVPGGGPS